MKHFKKGEVLASEGETSSEMFMLVSGKIGIFKRELKIAEYSKKGDVVGEMSAILGKPRTATIKALNDSLVVNIPASFDKLIDDHPEIAKKIMFNAVEKLKNTTDDFYILASDMIHADEGPNLNKYKEMTMDAHTEYLTFNTRTKREYINITRQVEDVLLRSGIKEGMILVSAMHITAGVYVNDAEQGLISDIDEWLEKVAPYNEHYLHHRTGETNGDAHLKSMLVHHQVLVPVTNGQLDLGPWQQIYYAEFDGQRKKRLIIKVMGE